MKWLRDFGEALAIMALGAGFLYLMGTAAYGAWVITNDFCSHFFL